MWNSEDFAPPFTLRRAESFMASWKGDSSATNDMYDGSYLRAPSFANMDFKHTGLVNLCSDRRGNMFLNQYVIVKDLGSGAFGKVHSSRVCMHANQGYGCKKKTLRVRLTMKHWPEAYWQSFIFGNREKFFHAC
jgi:hypothetical protein